MLVRLLIGVWMLSLSMSSYAADRPCGKEDAIATLKAIGEINSVQSLYQSYLDYSHCDDGAMWEGFSDKTSYLIAEEWGSFGELSKLVESDLGFKRFVIKHIDETVPYGRVEKIVENVTTRCPERASVFCGLVECQINMTRELADK